MKVDLALTSQKFRGLLGSQGFIGTVGRFQWSALVGFAKMSSRISNSALIPLVFFPLRGSALVEVVRENLSPGSRRGLAAWSHVRRADRIFSIFLPDTKSGFRTFFKTNFQGYRVIP